MWPCPFWPALDGPRRCALGVHGPPGAGTAAERSLASQMFARESVHDGALFPALTGAEWRALTCPGSRALHRDRVGGHASGAGPVGLTRPVSAYGTSPVPLCWRSGWRPRAVGRRLSRRCAWARCCAWRVVCTVVERQAPLAAGRLQRRAARECTACETSRRQAPTCWAIAQLAGSCS